MWSNKPMRPESENPLFVVDEDSGYTVKSLSPIERQRYKDGSPMTGVRPGLSAPEPALYLRKSSHAEDLHSYKAPQVDPEVYGDDSPANIIKSYLQS